MYVDVVFYFGLALLFTHELDAIKRHEWRIFPFINRLEDNTGYLVFTVLHIPLFVLLMWLCSHPSPEVQQIFQVSLDTFFIAHWGLHTIFKNHKKYEFHSAFSKAIILLMALAGLIHINILIFQS